MIYAALSREYGFTPDTIAGMTDAQKSAYISNMAKRQQ